MKNPFAKAQPSPEEVQAKADYLASVAPQAVEVGEDCLKLPGSVILPLTLRGVGMPGLPERPWAKLSASDFFQGLPLLYSLVLRREAPDVLRGSLRARRTLFEAGLLALSEKTGRRPSQAEQAADLAMDTAESELSLGSPAFRVSLLAALYAPPEQAAAAETTRRTLEGSLKAKGFVPQRLHYIAERALYHLQPGGDLFPGFDKPVLMLHELPGLLPTPSRRVLPAGDSVRIGRHVREGRDVYYSFQHGFDPTAPPPPHALTLILGEMGSGKTSLMRLILLQRLLQGRTIVTLDPEGENNRLCEAVGGRVVPAGVPTDPDVCLLHPLQAGDAAEMLMAAKFLLSTISERTKLSAGEQAALHEAVKRRWARRPGSMRVAELVDALGAVNVPEAVNLIAYLRPFAAEGLWEGFFDRPQALIVPDLPAGTWVNYDLSALREESKAIVYAVLAWFLYHTVTLRPKLDASRVIDAPVEGLDVFIDEGWRLLRQGMFADLLDELGRRARKRGVGVVLTTHLPGDLSKNNSSLAFAANAFLGRMGPDEAYGFFRSLGISEAEARKNAEWVARLPPRTFLAAPSGGRGGLFPVQVQIPKIWLDLWTRLQARN